MKVGIFGSCRQVPIQTYFEVPNIHEELTYPHYTKEIIEAIRYCRGESTISDNDAQHCFRAGLLYKRPLNKEYIQSAFQQCSIFLVEIASRKTYEWNGQYVHHIATEEKYNCPFRTSITSRMQSDEEIEEDIHEIRKLLYPRPFIIISHIHTYKEGPRYELIQLLQRVSNCLNIPCISPSDELQGFSEGQLYQPESKLAHYTQFGTQLIIDVYRKKILNVLAEYSNTQKIIQCYYTDEERVKKVTFHGFGDYIRGCLYVYRFCKENKIKPCISFSHHILSNYLYSKTYRSLEECKAIEYCFKGYGAYSIELDTLQLPATIFTNNTTSFDTLTDDEREFLKDNCLTQRLMFSDYLQSIKKKHMLVDKEYCVFHIRAGDTNLIDSNTNNIDHTMRVLKQYCQTKGIEYSSLVCISDTVQIEEECSKLGMKTLGTKKVHIGHHVQTDENVRDTLVDFFIMTTAKEIHQFSVYDWASGFSKVASCVFNIPLYINKL